MEGYVGETMATTKDCAGEPKEATNEAKGSMEPLGLAAWEGQPSRGSEQSPIGKAQEEMISPQELF